MSRFSLLLAAAWIAVIAFCWQPAELVASEVRPLFIPGHEHLAVPTEVLIGSGVEGATVRYTTDGTLPHAGSPVLTEGQRLWIDRATEVRAQAFNGSAPVGPVAVRLYQVTGKVEGSVYHTLLLTRDGELRAVGANGGRLGTGDGTSLAQYARVLVPEPV